MAEKLKIKLAPHRSIADSLRVIPYDTLRDRVVDCCLEAAYNLPAEVLSALKAAFEKESSVIGKECLAQCIDNAAIAAQERMPLCQDTGIAVFFVEMGEYVRLDRGSIYEAISEGVEIGYQKGFLRKSMVTDPLFKRKNTKTNCPPIIHLHLVPGDKIQVTLAPKGGGSENMSALRMLKPSEGREGVKKFVVESVIAAGGNPCPPTIVGVGIGGNFEESALLAKKALLRPLGQPNEDPDYAALEQEILAEINASGIGPQGLGGDVTSLAVHIDYLPCHIASMPVAVNLNCHAARHASFEL